MTYITYRCRYTDHGFALADIYFGRSRAAALRAARGPAWERGIHYEVVRFSPGMIRGPVIAMIGARGNPVSA